jgi:hypothetical protein
LQIRIYVRIYVIIEKKMKKVKKKFKHLCLWKGGDNAIFLFFGR